MNLHEYDDRVTTREQYIAYNSWYKRFDIKLASGVVEVEVSSDS